MLSEKAWSLLDPKPVVLYLTEFDDYLVYWNGILMTHRIGLSIGMSCCGIHATPQMKSAMEHHYRQLYYAGAFNTRKWDKTVRNSPIYSVLTRIMTPHLDKFCKSKSAKEILPWFDYSKSRIIKTLDIQD